jgi:hypothetical protein
MAIEARTVPESHKDTPPKRGPGRPKGSKNKPKDPVDQVASELKGNGDKPPGAGKRKTRISKRVTDQIEEALAEILCAPAMAAAFVGDQWAIEHFTTTGKELAHRIAVVSERNSQLRAYCERALEGESIMILALGFIAYTVPPLIHWNIIPGPDGMMGIPKAKRGTRRRRGRQATEESPTDATEWQREETEYQQYEREAAQRAETNGHAESPEVYAEFDGESEGSEPPTFIETPG